MSSPSTPQPAPSLVGRWLHHFRVGQKIGLGYALALGLAVVGTTTGILIGNTSQNRAHRLLDDAFEETKILTQLEIAITHARSHQQNLATLLLNPENLQATQANFEEHAAVFRENWAALEASYQEDVQVSSLESAEEVALMAALTEQHQVVESYLQQAERLLDQLDLASLSTREIEALQAELLTLAQNNAADLERFSKSLESSIAESNEELKTAEETILAAQTFRNQAVACSMLLSVALAALFAILISRSITRPIKSLESLAQQVTHQEDFNLQAPVFSADEVGTLATAFNQLIDRVGDRTEALEQARNTLEQTVKERTQQLNAIIDNLGDGLLVTNASGQITRFNPALLKMFNLPTAALHPPLVIDHLNATLAALVAENRANPDLTPTADIELTEGRIGQALVSSITQEATATADHQSVVLIRDITAEKEIDQMKTDFISTVSHELRTPLTSVLGFARLVQKKLEEVILPYAHTDDKKTQRAVRQVRDNLQIIVSEGERLTALINDVLDIAKIEAGKIEWNMQPIAINTLLEQAIAATTVLAQNSGLRITLDPAPDLPPVAGDRDRLIQVMINLISNAIKFTEKGAITCRTHQQGEEIIVSVVDPGVGIAEGDRDKVFEKFKQVGAVMTNKPKGTGLGLPICKQIIEHHGGRIWVESTLGEGSTFSFALPLIPEAVEGISALDLKSLLQQLKENVDRTAHNESNQTQKTILVVDDEPQIRNLLRQELEEAGYRVQEAPDGISALQQVKVSPPDLIILDVMMPNINGFDLAAVLKNNPDTMAIPTIILSIIQDQARGYRLGIDSYISKPVDTDRLLEDVRSLLAKGPSQKKVLIVDADLSVNKALTQVLLSKGYAVTEAMSGADGIQKALSFKPDMIIVDANLSKAHDMVKTLRFDNGLENIFFILLGKDGAIELNA